MLLARARRPLVDLDVIRVVGVVAVALDARRHVITLTNRRGGIRLIAIDDLGPVVVLHPVALAASVVLDVYLLVPGVDSPYDSVQLSRRRLLHAAAEHAAEDVAEAAVAAPTVSSAPLTVRIRSVR